MKAREPQAAGKYREVRADLNPLCINMKFCKLQPIPEFDASTESRFAAFCQIYIWRQRVIAVR